MKQNIIDKFTGKDKITKIVETKEGNIYKIYGKNENLLIAHKAMESFIDILYNKNNFTYKELLDRKRFLTTYKENVFNILISLFCGIVASVVYSFLLKLHNFSLQWDSISHNGFMVIISIIILLILFYYINKSAKFISNNDLYNIKQYELGIIQIKLKQYENDKEL